MVAVDQNKLFSVFEPQTPEVLCPEVVSQGICETMLYISPHMLASSQQPTKDRVALSSLWVATLFCATSNTAF